MNFSFHPMTRCVNVLTPGAACDTAASLPEAGALQHHPPLVWFFPGLPYDVRRRRTVVVATLGCNTGRGVIRFIGIASRYYAIVNPRKGGEKKSKSVLAHSLTRWAAAKYLL